MGKMHDLGVLACFSAPLNFENSYKEKHETKHIVTRRVRCVAGVNILRYVRFYMTIKYSIGDVFPTMK